MKIVKHIVTIVLLLGVFLGIPFLIYKDRIISHINNVDVLSGATQIVEAPSGKYVIIINNKATGDETEEWLSFFEGEEVGLLWTDLKCIVAETDVFAVEMALSLASRLPANQLVIDRQQAILAASKAVEGVFEVAVFSMEFADKYGLPDTCKLSDYEVVLR